MKNVILYFKIKDAPYKAHESIIKYLHAQIDNSLHYGWNPADIVVITNFEFSYKGITQITAKDICEYNVWANKFYSVKELFDLYFKDDIWLHDYDVWQTGDFTFPTFSGMFAGCPYGATNPNWNGGSFFFSKNSYPLLEYIVNFYKMNEEFISNIEGGEKSYWYCDEFIVSYLRTVPEVAHLFSPLTPQYNLGMTSFKARYEFATKPIKAIHVKLLHKEERDKYNNLCEGLNLIPDHLSDIINKYSL